MSDVSKVAISSLERLLDDFIEVDPKGAERFIEGRLAKLTLKKVLEEKAEPLRELLLEAREVIEHGGPHDYQHALTGRIGAALGEKP